MERNIICFAVVAAVICLEVMMYRMINRANTVAGHPLLKKGSHKFIETKPNNYAKMLPHFNGAKLSNFESEYDSLLDEYDEIWIFILSFDKYLKTDEMERKALGDGYLLLRSRVENVQMLVSESRGDSIKYSENFIPFWHLFSDIKHFWMQAMSAFQNVGVGQNYIEILGHKFWSLLSNIEALLKKSEDVRKKILDKLSAKVNNKINKFQNPENCEDSRLIVYTVRTNAECGFGCETHSLVCSLMQAMRSQRTLVYISKGWRYAEEGREYAFLPLNNCSKVSSFRDGANDENSRILRFKSGQYGPWIGSSIPRQLAPTLQKYHAEPFLWWIGQLINFAMKLQPWMTEELHNIISRTGFQSPVVGIHIRRGDKLQGSGGYHDVDEYMFYVDQYFNYAKKNNKKIKPTIFLATEDKSALTELELRYPDYKIIVTKQIKEKVTKNIRYGDGGLEGIIFDILLLSRCDYIVCTLSSNVCRAAYEIMSAIRVDAATRIHSLDTGHRLKTVYWVPWRATDDHIPITKDELQVQKGDKLKVTMKYGVSLNNGYVSARNNRTGKHGKIPTYKARKELDLINFSIFDDP